MEQSTDRGWLSRLAEPIVHRVVQNSAFFYYARTHFYWGTMRRMRQTLDIQPGERLLDVGCGAGMGAGLTSGTYVGIDNELTYLRFARKRLKHLSTHSFLSMSALELGFADDTFDKAMMLNVVHHLDEEMLDRFFTELSRVVKNRVFVLDHAPERDNLISGWLVSMDRGAYMRESPELRHILERHYHVEKHDVFYNAEHTISHVLFTLVPRSVDA
jgi:ubiquinone/menaquinone biosynthesis C-methylase UbiE